MTISEIASQLRVALGVCVGAGEDVSSAERSYFAAVQNDASDEEVISFWLSVSYLEDHQVPMFIAKQWGQRASNISEWMALLERNTAPPETTDGHPFLSLNLDRLQIRRGTIHAEL